MQKISNTAVNERKPKPSGSDFLLNPIWNETFTIICNPKKIPDIKVQVYDYNFITKEF